MVVIITDGKTNTVNKWPFGSENPQFDSGLARAKLRREVKLLASQGADIHAVGVGHAVGHR